MTTLPLLDKLFLIFNIFTRLKRWSIFSLSLFLFNNVILSSKQLLADAFLLVLSQLGCLTFAHLGLFIPLLAFASVPLRPF